MGVITYKCPNCGGSLKFNAESQDWKCEFCLSALNNDEIKSIEERFNTEAESMNKGMPEPEDIESQRQANLEFESDARIYSCNSCGAEIVTDKTTAATFCYYCHNPAIIPGQLSGSYRPAKVIPFKLKKAAATEMFIKWCKKKPLLSKSFTTSSQLELLSGVYVPFWLFDCDTRGDMTAYAKKVRTWVSGDKKYTETKTYNIVRSGNARFLKLPADGSSKADDKLMETLEPYDYSQMEDFSMSYLSGYMAEKYDKNQNEVFGRIQDRVQQYTKKLLQDTIVGYSSVTVNTCNINIRDSKAAYVLLPTWMFTYKYRGKTYVFAMNGQTGKIAGSLPISTGRAAAWFGAVSAGVFALLLIGGMFI